MKAYEIIVGLGNKQHERCNTIWRKSSLSTALRRYEPDMGPKR